MASYCCFRKASQPTSLHRLQLMEDYYYGPSELISFQGMLGLLVRTNVGVVVIQGIGGTGKTWAAKAAYRTAKISNLFDEYIWVSLSLNCSMRHCLNEIAASISCCNSDNLSVESTRTTIKEYLTRRKFLLVLDNSYFTEDGILEYLGVPCPQQQSLGSKIFVTTRSTRAEMIMGICMRITPQPLTYEESYDLLREKIGKDISLTHDLVNCYGVPLIIILLAGVLCDAPTQEATSELVAKAQVALGNQVSVFNTINRMVEFAYRQLPSNNARNCLLYCLLFPDFQGIPVKELIWHWMMDGLIQQAAGFDEANHNGTEILEVLIKHGMVFLEDNDRVRIHDVIRETVSSFGFVNGYKEGHGRYFDNPIVTLDRMAEFKRISLMYCEMEFLHGSPPCFMLSSLLLRGNYLLRSISEDFFCSMGILQMLDLSFTRIEALPSSISYLTKLRMLLLTGCDRLKEIRHIGLLTQLEVLDASGCCSLKWIHPGSFDGMVLLKILDLSATSVTFLTFPTSIKLRHLNLRGCPFLRSELPYGVSRSGALRNLQLSNIEDLADGMRMLWLPCGLTFQLSDKSGMKVSLDVNGDDKTYVYASDAYFFNCLKKDSPLWFNCFQKFQIVISPFMDDQTRDTDAQLMNTYSSFHNSYFGGNEFTHSIHSQRNIELNGTVGVPSDLDGILYHAELVSLKRLTMTTEVSDLNIGSMKSVRELRIENCDELDSLLTLDELQALSAMGSLHELRVSNIENLSSFCKGVKDVTVFGCLKHFHLDCCPNVACLFPSALRIPCLEMLRVRFCDNLERVLDTCVLGEVSLPRLQSLQLWELPELTSICGGALPSLKKLEVRSCAKLWKIPVGVNESNPFVTTIIGGKMWWDNLTWDDETIKRLVVFRNWGPLLPHLATEG